MAKASENRKLVYEILLELERSEQKADTLLHAVLDKYDYMEQRDKAFITRLTEGCIERKLTLDHVIAQYAKTKNGRVGRYYYSKRILLWHLNESRCRNCAPSYYRLLCFVKWMRKPVT